MAQEKKQKTPDKMLSPREIEIIMADGSPWTYTTAPNRLKKEPAPKTTAVLV